MARFSAALLAILALAACGTLQRASDYSMAYRPGIGVVESVAAPLPPIERSVEAGGASTPRSTYSQPAYATEAVTTPFRSDAASSASGGSAPGPGTVTVRMDDGSRQTLPNPGGTGIGERVQVTAEGRIVPQEKLR